MTALPLPQIEVTLRISFADERELRWLLCEAEGELGLVSNWEAAVNAAGPQLLAFRAWAAEHGGLAALVRWLLAERQRRITRRGRACWRAL